MLFLKLHLCIQEQPYFVSCLPFRTKLKDHIAAVHSTDRPFACHDCGKCFALNSHLRIHMKGHLPKAQRPKPSPRKKKAAGPKGAKGGGKRQPKKEMPGAHKEDSTEDVKEAPPEEEQTTVIVTEEGETVAILDGDMAA